MKKILLLALFSVLVSPIFAFDMSVGVKGSVGWQYAMGNKPDNAREGNSEDTIGSDVKGNVGGYVELGLMRFLALQFEVTGGLHNSYGTRFGSDGSGVEKGAYLGYYFNSLDLALLVKGRVDLTNNLRFTLAVGPSFNIGVGDVVTETKGFATGNGTEKSSFENMELSPFTMSLIIDVGLEIGLGEDAKYGYIPVGLRGEWNMWNLTNRKDNPTYNSDNSLYLHSPIGAFVGYGYRFMNK